MLFQEGLKAARKKAGLTQAQLADRIGINRATLARYESGQINPPYAQVEKITAALGVPFYALFYANPVSADIMQDLEDLAEDIDSLLSIIKELIVDGQLSRDKIAHVLERLPDRAAIKERLERLIELARAVDSGDELLAGLNDLGKEEALKRIDELTMIPKYQQKPHEAAGTVLARSKDKDT